MVPINGRHCLIDWKTPIQRVSRDVKPLPFANAFVEMTWMSLKRCFIKSWTFSTVHNPIRCRCLDKLFFKNLYDDSRIMGRIVAVIGRRMSGKTTFINQLQKTTEIPFFYVSNVNVLDDSLFACMEKVCIVLDDLSLNAWQSPQVENLFLKAKNNKETYIVYACQSYAGNIPPRFREQTDKVLQCPTQTSEPAFFDAIFGA